MRRLLTSRDSWRAAIAIGIAVILTHFAAPQFPYWITMTTIILMQSNIGASIAKSYHRVLGTIFGLLAGLMLAMLFPHQVLLAYIAFPVLLLLFIYTLVFSYGLSMFFMTALLALLFTYIFPDPWHFMFWRIIDTLLGAAIAILASLLLFPTWARRDFSDSLIDGIKATQQLLQNLIEELLYKEKVSDFIPKVIDIEALLLKRRQYYANLRYEPGALNLDQGAVHAVLIAQERMHSLLLSLRIATRRPIKITAELQIGIERFITVNARLVDDLALAIDRKKAVPDFTESYAALCRLKEIAIQQEDDNVMVLLYRNLSGYNAELKHITQAILQLRRDS